MAIQFASVKIIKASSGSAVGLSRYIERSKGRDEINGQSYNFESRGGLIESGLVLPDHAPERMKDSENLWNEAIASEYVTDRKTGEIRLSKNGEPQVAKSYVLALPKELTNEQNGDLVRAYICENFEKSNVAVQWAIHTPHDGNENIHAHLMVSTRRLEIDGFGKKATELNPTFCKGRIVEQDYVGEKWAAFQNRFFHERDISLNVDPTRIVAGINEGHARFIEASEKEKHQEALAERNRELARDPERVLAHLTKNEATFTERQLDAFLSKSGLSEFEQAESRAAVFAQPDLVRLEEGRRTQKGEIVVLERFTVSAILEQERRIVDDGAVLRTRDDLGTSEAARESRTLTDEQRAAFDYATRGEGLAIIQGRAGTGKSYIAGAIREAYERDGYRVIGLAPTNTVAADMRADGFREGRTLAGELLRQENGREVWDGRTVVVLDEMGMVSSRDLDRLLSHARESGAKIVGFGDERQLASVERGGMFGPLAKEAQAVALVQVNRQKVDWQREASEAVSRGDFKAAIDAYAEHKNIRWTETVEDAYCEIKAHWTDEAAQGKTPFVYAATNDAVDRLNKELRDARIELGQISRDGETVFATEKGERRNEIALSAGDRIQFNATVKDRAAGLELRNGEFGTVLGIEGECLRVHTDAGRLVSFDACEHRGFALGYAGTTYKGQGKTNERTIAFYDNAQAWKARGAYVNLTRHKEDLRLVVPSELAPSRKELAQQMAREDGRKAASAYKIAPEQKQQREIAQEVKPEKPDPKEAQRRALESLRARASGQEKQKEDRAAMTPEQRRAAYEIDVAKSREEREARAVERNRDRSTDRDR